jgi:hypothetical protein
MRRGRSAAVLVALLATGCGGQSVVVRDEGGREVARAELPASGRFALEYRHSYYRVPARESFAADGDAFRIVEVSSPSEAVLDYYALAGRKRPGRWVRLELDRPQRFRRLPLAATPTGRRTLVVDGRRYPLYDGVRHVTLSLE